MNNSNKKFVNFKKQILYSIEYNYLNKELCDYYFKLINNKMFLNAKDDNNIIKNMILNIVYNLDNKDCFIDIYKISTNKDFWEKYTFE